MKDGEPRDFPRFDQVELTYIARRAYPVRRPIQEIIEEADLLRAEIDRLLADLDKKKGTLKPSRVLRDGRLIANNDARLEHFVLSLREVIRVMREATSYQSGSLELSRDRMKRWIGATNALFHENIAPFLSESNHQPNDEGCFTSDMPEGVEPIEITDDLLKQIEELNYFPHRKDRAIPPHKLSVHQWAGVIWLKAPAGCIALNYVMDEEQRVPYIQSAYVQPGQADEDRSFSLENEAPNVGRLQKEARQPKKGPFAWIGDAIRRRMRGE